MRCGDKEVVVRAMIGRDHYLNVTCKDQLTYKE